MHGYLRIFSLALIMSFYGCDQDSSVSAPAPLPDASPERNDGGVAPVLQDEGAPLLDAGADADVPGGAGDSCQGPEECESEYCLPDPEGNRVCADFCRTDEDCPEGWECSPVSNTRPDTVFLCVASRRVQCLPCNQDGDCGTGADRCIEIGQSLRCATDCSTLECPEGSACSETEVEGEVLPLCIPEEDSCDPCDDPDGDGYGNSGECLGVDCDEENDSVYEGAAEICDGLDNDCNSVPDDGLTEEDAPEDLTCLAEGVCVGTLPSCFEGAWGCAYADTYEPDTELACDGFDNDCDGVVDEAIDPPPARLIQGVCEGAVQVCAGEGGFVEPDYTQIAGYEVEETLCDGLDNDCDNQADENLDTPLADLQSGVCLGAQKVCAGDRGFAEPDYGRIVGYENVEATCDGLDNDCDGSIDEGIQAPLSDEQAGVCAGALRVCAGEAGFVEPDYSALPNYLLEETLCDGLDNDCDEAVDEGVEPPLADLQDGVCAETIKVCQGADGLVEPEYSAIESYEEEEGTCDGLDNDCDGGVDEGLVAPQAVRQLGVCAGSLQICSGQDGFVEPDYSALATYQNVENLCDGLDNDCDGTTDEGLQLPLAENQLGICAGSQKVCSGNDGYIEPDYGALGNHEAEEVTCDGLDNDCDGQVDNDLTSPDARLNQGVCEGMVQVCRGQAGWGEPDYLAVDGYEGAEVTCDGLDNDCDGTVDEGLAAPLADNQNGICAGSLKVCAGPEGWVEPDYTQRLNYAADDGAPYALDRDCDGVTGNRETMIFVADNGDDAEDGSDPLRPMASIGFAISRCANRAGCSVVALKSGSYELGSPLLGRGGIHIIGGYGENFASRAIGQQHSEILSDAQIGVLYVGLQVPTEIDGIGLRKGDQVAESAENIGIAVLDSGDHLIVKNSFVAGGRGGPGAAGDDGANGVAGGRGLNGSGSSAGAGGVRGGGRGGSGRNRASGNNGNAGSNNDSNGGAGGQGGRNGLGCNDGDAALGSNGSNGIRGPNGESATNGPVEDALGTFDGIVWRPTASRAGTSGGQGGGGGGGGAGGGENCTTESCVNVPLVGRVCTPDVCVFCGTGRGGGGGGGGGTGGEGGQGGTSGGPSIGVLVSNSTFTGLNFLLVGGEGGVGGAAGSGGAGGSGGGRGSGATNNESSDGNGGDGGEGGRGGAGGCGTPGHGGSWIGFWGIGNAVVLQDAGAEDGHAPGVGGSGGERCRAIPGAPAGNDAYNGISREYHNVQLDIVPFP